MAFFIMEYRSTDYGIRQAFSRDPKAGRRTFFVSGDDIGTHDLAEVERMARMRDATPEGYELFSVIDRDANKEPRHD
jgi:hypothetical protein